MERAARPGRAGAGATEQASGRACRSRGHGAGSGVGAQELGHGAGSRPGAQEPGPWSKQGNREPRKAWEPEGLRSAVQHCD